MDGIFVKSKRLSKARGADVWFKFSTKEAEEAAMKAAANAALEEAENEDGPIEYEEVRIMVSFYFLLKCCFACVPG